MRATGSHAVGDRRLLAALLGWCAAIALFDLALGGNVALIGVLATAPLIAAAFAHPRIAAIVSVWAVALAVTLGLVDGDFGSTGRLIALGEVVVVSALSTWLAAIRRGLERARFRDRLVADAGATMSAGLDADVTLIELARLCARRLCDWCFAFVLEEDGSIRQVAAAHADPDRQRLAWELLLRYPLDPGRPEGPAKVIRTGAPDLHRQVDDSLLRAIAADDENLRLLRALELRSAMITPLLGRGRILGAIAFARSTSAAAFGADDLALAEELSGRAAIAVDNARLYARVSETEAEVRAARDQVQAILGGVADAVTAQDAGGRLVYANDAAARQLGFASSDELLAADERELMARFEMLDGEGRPFPLERLPGRRALAGEDPQPVVVCYRDRATREERWSQLKATAIRSEDGRPLLAINVIEDVTEQRVREHRQRLLAATGGALAASLDVRRTFPVVARLVAEAMGDWCAIEVIDADDSVRTVGFAATDAGSAPAAEELMRRYPVARPRSRYLGRELENGGSLLLTDLSEKDYGAAACDPEHLALFLQLQPRAAMTVPMTLRGSVVGAVTVISAGSGRRLDPAALMLLEEIAGRCALALDNARLYEERSRIARTLQESLLPPLLPDLPGLDVAARFRAAGEGIEVGGDFYDLFEVGDEGWAVAIGDVCGKGTGAAAVTALARYTVRAAAMRQEDPSQILAVLNEALLRQGSARRFCTVLYGRLSINGRGAWLEFSSGGHPLPLLLRAGGGIELGEPGTLLGIVPDPSLRDDEVRLEPGDAVVLYTDGVTDAGAPQRVWTGPELASVIGTTAGLDADAIAERMLRAAVDTAAGEPRDDIAIVVLKVPEQPPAAGRGVAGAPPRVVEPAP